MAGEVAVGWGGAGLLLEGCGGCAVELGCGGWDDGCGSGCCAAETGFALASSSCTCSKSLLPVFDVGVESLLMAMKGFRTFGRWSRIAPK